LTEESKNLAEVTRQEIAQREGTKQAVDIKGKIVEFAWHLQKEGYKSAKNRVDMIRRLIALGANLYDPESIKETLAKQTTWKDGYKMLMMYAYESFLKMEGMTWTKPRYRQEETLPLIPKEEELDQLITGSGKKVGTFLQGLKDTGADPGEMAKLRWIDINSESRTLNITPVKNHNPRTVPISDEFLRRLGTLPKSSQYVFNYQGIRTAFNVARKSITRKLGNPRLKAITMTTFRHWKGTIEYHKTKDIIHVKALLGHRNIQNTMVYINLERAIFTTRNDEFHSSIAKNVEDACRLIEAGFEYVTGEYNDGGKIFRKRK
jgi:integrase